MQEALEEEQAAAFGRGRYEARGEKLGYRNGYEKGTLKTARRSVPGGSAADSGAGRTLSVALWGKMAKTSDVLKGLNCRDVWGGMSQRDIEYSLEKALGQFVLSKRTVSELSESLTAGVRSVSDRDLSQETSRTSLWIRCMSRCGAGAREDRGALCVGDL